MLIVGRKYKMPSGEVIIVLSVDECRALVQPVSGGAKFSIAPTSQIKEVKK